MWLFEAKKPLPAFASANPKKAPAWAWLPNGEELFELPNGKAVADAAKLGAAVEPQESRSGKYATADEEPQLLITGQRLLGWGVATGTGLCVGSTMLRHCGSTFRLGEKILAVLTRL